MKTDGAAPEAQEAEGGIGIGHSEGAGVRNPQDLRAPV